MHQTSVVKDLGKATIVGVVHQVEITVDRGRDGLDLVHDNLRSGQYLERTRFADEPSVSARTNVAHSETPRHPLGCHRFDD